VGLAAKDGMAALAELSSLVPVGDSRAIAIMGGTLIDGNGGSPVPDAAVIMRDGIPIMAGTDQTIPGHSMHREIELYVKAGFTPIEAIQAATLVPARALGLDKESGTVEIGKRATSS
jgi:imidazolonepropionase-like amidohydrolase